MGFERGASADALVVTALNVNRAVQHIQAQQAQASAISQPMMHPP